MCSFVRFYLTAQVVWFTVQRFKVIYLQNRICKVPTEVRLISARSTVETDCPGLSSTEPIDLVSSNSRGKSASSTRNRELRTLNLNSRNLTPFSKMPCLDLVKPLSFRCSGGLIFNIIPPEEIPQNADDNEDGHQNHRGIRTECRNSFV
jgi:hypothetical protein